MTPHEWTLLKEAFAELIDLDEHARATRLAAMQPEHAAALRRLLSADAEAASRLGQFESEPEPVADPLGLVGRFVAQFRVLHVLGSGGMGVAYAAEDTRLGRSVALKFLLPHVASDPDARQRFLHEARAASALDHPNVCTLLEIGDSPFGPFLAMPAYPGATLKTRLERGPLPIDEAVDIARQILSGLAAAHDAGITHRDLKPANVLVTPDGSVRILDFGLARIGDLRLSAPGVRAGTVAYMSPEQVADDEVDARSDLWAVGVVLFEMLTGRRPFGGGHDLSTIYSILHEPPPVVSDLRAGVPPGLAAVVARLLSKRPEERYTSAAAASAALIGESSPHARLPARDVRRPRHAAALLFALVALIAAAAVPALRGWLGEAAVADDARSVAVMPFADTSPDRSQEHLGDGIAEEILNVLAQVPGLRVSARGASFAVGRSELPLREISRRLDVATLLEGSVHRDGDHIRITARLVDAASGRNIWAQTFEDRFASLYTLQAQIAAAAAGAMQRRFEPQATAGGSANISAIELYLRGLFHWNRRTARDLTQATQFFEQAALLDPNYAKPWAGLALTYAVLAPFDVRTVPLLERVDSIAGRALALDPLLAEAYAARGYAAHWLWRWQDAERDLRRATELNPRLSTAHQWYGEHLMKMGEFERALAHMRTAIDLDPASLVARNDLGILLYLSGDFDAAVAQLEQVRALDPAFPLPNLLLYRVHLVGGNVAAAADAGRRWAELSNAVAAADLTTLARATGDAALRDEALAVLSRWQLQERPNWPDIAMYYTLLGDHDAAVRALEEGFVARAPMMVQLNVAPWLEPLRSDRRVQDLIERMAFPAR